MRKPTLGRGLADLLGQTRPIMVPAVVPLARLPRTRQARNWRGCRWTCCSAAATSRAWTCAPSPSTSWPTPSVPRAWCSRSWCARWSCLGAGGSQRYEIIAGERRWRAAQLAGLSEIPAIIRHIPDEAAIAVALIENIQRENLNPLEEARALERLISEFGLTHQQAAEAVGRSRAGVSNLLRLLELAPEVCELLEQRQLEMGHARALLGLTSAASRSRWRRWWRRRGSRCATPRRWCGACRRRRRPAAPQASSAGGIRTSSAWSRTWPRSSVRGWRSSTGSGGKGKLVVSYNSLDELDGILAHIQ